jgi:hypothetical protein
MEVEPLAGELAEAEALAPKNLDRCERMGYGWPDFWRIQVARVLLEQGRIDEAEDMLARVARLEEDDEAGMCEALASIAGAHRSGKTAPAKKVGD